MIKKCFFANLSLLAMILTACAQCPKPDAQNAAVMEAPATSSLDESVDLLFETLKVRESYQKITATALDEQIAMNPNLAPLKSTMAEFFNKYMGWDAVGPEIKKLYMEAFTKDEIDEMIVFYRTPTGQKAASLTSELMSKGAQIGRKKVEENLPELQAMIAAKLKQMYQTAPEAEQEARPSTITE